MSTMLTLGDVVCRTDPPAPWAEGDNIPWNDPDFSKRMLREHLCQEHDLASRRTEKLDHHVRWIHETVIGARPTRVLDLACGPGLYTMRLAKLGCECVGIDFSPAAVAYAREEAVRERLACEYIESDVRIADFGERFGLVMMVYGQFNVFRRSEARRILACARGALAEGGSLLLELQRCEQVRQSGAAGPSWSASEAGLFSDRPHLVLKESFWDEDSRTGTERFHVVDAESGEVTRHALSNVAYSEEEIVAVITNAGFRDVVCYPSLNGITDESDHHCFAVVART